MAVAAAEARMAVGVTLATAQQLGRGLPEEAPDRPEETRRDPDRTEETRRDPKRPEETRRNPKKPEETRRDPKIGVIRGVIPRSSG
jgi:hypothetical protein